MSELSFRPRQADESIGSARATAATMFSALPTTTVTGVSLYAYVAPAESIASSFGVRSERGAVLIRVEDASGSFGWGEVWSGMPASGALHRLNLLREFVAPALVGTTFQAVQPAVARLCSLTLPIIRLAGERGPVAQILGGMDTALWDLRPDGWVCPCIACLGARKPACAAMRAVWPRTHRPLAWMSCGRQDITHSSSRRDSTMPGLSRYCSGNGGRWRQQRR